MQTTETSSHPAGQEEVQRVVEYETPLGPGEGGTLAKRNYKIQSSAQVRRFYINKLVKVRFTVCLKNLDLVCKR